MGCDIHIYIERKLNGKWRHYDNFRNDPLGYLKRVELIQFRSYELFSILAGIKGSEECIESPRGIPNNLSEVVLSEWEDWENDAHSASHFSLEELQRHPSDHPNYISLLCRLQNMADDDFEDSKDIRIVFWFDN